MSIGKGVKIGRIGRLGRRRVFGIYFGSLGQFGIYFGSLGQFILVG